MSRSGGVQTPGAECDGTHGVCGVVCCTPVSGAVYFSVHCPALALSLYTVVEIVTASLHPSLLVGRRMPAALETAEDEPVLLCSPCSIQLPTSSSVISHSFDCGHASPIFGHWQSWTNPLETTVKQTPTLLLEDGYDVDAFKPIFFAIFTFYKYTPESF